MPPWPASCLPSRSERAGARLAGWPHEGGHDPTGAAARRSRIHDSAVCSGDRSLGSSHLTVHGATDRAIAAGFATVNIAKEYSSPDLNRRNRAFDSDWSHHDQPRDAQITIDKIRQLPRRSKIGDLGYDALSIVIIDCANDESQIEIVSAPPAPQPADICSYASMIGRLARTRAARFEDL